MAHTNDNITIAELETGLERLEGRGLRHVETDIKRDVVDFRDGTLPRIGITANIMQVAYGIVEPAQTTVHDV